METLEGLRYMSGEAFIPISFVDSEAAITAN